MKNKLSISMILLLGMLLMGCDNIEFASTADSNDTGSGTKAPIANAGTDKATPVFQAIEIVGTAVAGDGEIVGYEWRENLQLISGLKRFIYTPSTEGNHTLTFTVVDANDLTDSDSMIVTVTTETNATN